MAPPEQFGKLSVLEHVSLTANVLLMPFSLAFSILTSSFREVDKNKPMKRRMGMIAFRFLTDKFSYRQLQKLFGTSLGTYTTFMNKEPSLKPLVEDIGEGGKLLWITPKRTERVILYVHGGAFLIGIQPASLGFWKYIHDELEKRHLDVGIAVLSYSIIPDGPFPVPLRQTVLCIQRLLEAGVRPENLQLAGDSAGGNLLLQLFSHMLHPHPSVPVLTLPTPFRSAYLMSPWLSLLGERVKLVDSNSRSDIVTSITLRNWGIRVFESVPESDHPYLDAVYAPQDWFKGLDKFVGRILITAGDAECLRDADESLYKDLKLHHEQVKFVLQPEGVHDDAFLDFMLMEKDLSSLTPLILDWLTEGLVARE
ncbi:Alpha/Beta hydrolase protein [Mycena floridula]|nr:Alpha/Beta hydrolase protein [Mycena floridula]